MSSNPSNKFATKQLLKQVGILNDKFATLIEKHPCIEELLSGCHSLLRAKILNPDYFAVLCQQPSPIKVAKVLTIVHNMGVLNTCMLELLKKHHFPAFIIRLHLIGRLTPDHLRQIFRPEYAFFTSKYAETHFWRVVGNDYLIEHWPGLLGVAGHPNPMQALEALGTPHHEQPPEINTAQSTHTTSIHLSASESALRLYKHYAALIASKNISTEIRSLLHELPSNQINNAAIRAFERLSDGKTKFIDPHSGLSMIQLLELSFFAIKDDGQRIGSLEDALTQWIRGLYEIQRGYNLDAHHRDNGGIDSPICISGSFNKVLETLQGVHPLVELRMVNRTIATYKLPIIVEEEGYAYLRGLASPTTKTGYLAFLDLLDRIEKEGISVIWSKIQATIKFRISHEFAELFPSTEALDEFIAAGQDTSLNQLQQFQAELSGSPGYHAWCRQYLLWNKQDECYTREKTRIMLKSV